MGSRAALLADKAGNELRVESGGIRGHHIVSDYYHRRGNIAHGSAGSTKYDPKELAAQIAEIIGALTLVFVPERLHGGYELLK